MQFEVGSMKHKTDMETKGGEEVQEVCAISSTNGSLCMKLCRLCFTAVIRFDG
jgi:hypothetical protein